MQVFVSIQSITRRTKGTFGFCQILYHSIIMNLFAIYIPTPLKQHYTYYYVAKLCFFDMIDWYLIAPKSENFFTTQGHAANPILDMGGSKCVQYHLVKVLPGYFRFQAGCCLSKTPLSLIKNLWTFWYRKSFIFLWFLNWRIRLMKNYQYYVLSNTLKTFKYWGCTWIFTIYFSIFDSI